MLVPDLVSNPNDVETNLDAADTQCPRHVGAPRKVVTGNRRIAKPVTSSAVVG
jgi:hypothetical protein